MQKKLYAWHIDARSILFWKPKCHGKGKWENHFSLLPLSHLVTRYFTSHCKYSVEEGKTNQTVKLNIPYHNIENKSEVVDENDILNPRELVSKLDKFIVGQTQAKRAVAIALRNRWRRQHLPENLRTEVIPKNILMIGPTGCGKTEIARRISRLCQAPFIKVEATKFTEVGFHGRDVDQIIRDLADAAIHMVTTKRRNELWGEANARARRTVRKDLTGVEEESDATLTDQNSGLMVPVHVSIKDKNKSPVNIGMFGNLSKEDFEEFVSRAMSPKRKHTKFTKMTTNQAIEHHTQKELDSMIDEDDVKREALMAVQENGIVFIDEIDKICTKQGSYQGADASAEGVQRDLLPLIEGCAITTRIGTVNTDFILFIASGAFHSCKPSDLLAELQGRLPIRVELSPLSEADLYKILTEPEPNLIRQSVEMMKVENVELQFEDEAIRAIARVAAEVNQTVENIGARRLQTIVEKVMEEISFEAPDMEKGTKITITAAMVKESVTDLMLKSDVSKYIL